MIRTHSLLPLAMVALLAGCQTAQVSTSNTLANQTRDQRVGVDTMQLESIDFEFAAKEAVDQFLQSPWYNNGKNRRWVAYMGEVINDSTSDVNTRSMTDRMRQYMTRSANFVFTAAVGSEATRGVAAYRQLERSGMFDQRTGASGLAVKPDLEISGSIRSATRTSVDRRRQAQEYEFSFRVVELGSGLEIFQGFVPINKAGSNRNFAW
jgi:PBP1b-binding outer membrane lipoprotein LpoB